MNLLTVTVFKLWKVFIFACYFLSHNEITASENLCREENISTLNVLLPCRYRCPILDNITQDYMNEGTKLSSENKLQQAVPYYIEAINVVSPENVDILENLAECYSKLGYHYRALEEANYILQYEPSYCFQGVYYKAKALSGLQRYTEAIQFVTTQMSINQDLKKSRDLINLLTKLKKLEYQQRTGDEDLLKLFKNDWVNEDYANYSGPVKIVEIPGKNRGVIATADIRAGQLLFVTKAFAIVYEEEFKDSHLLGHYELVEAVATKLEMEPEHADWFYQSYAGPKMLYLTHGVGNNSVDYRRIEGICWYTSITGPTANSGSRRRGLWILPAYINHNGFDANAIWLIYGDTMVVRAIKNISKGEEISVTFNDPTDAFELRDVNCKSHDFECSCSLCQADRNDSLEVREIRNWISSQFRTHSLSLTMMESYVAELEGLRPHNPELNVYIISPLKLIADDYYFKGQYEKAAESLMKAHKIAKNSPLATTAVECSIGILNCYITSGNQDMILKWIDIVKEDLITAYGSAEMHKVIEYSHMH